MAAGYTNYQSLQVSARRGLRSGLQLGVSYTWSHSLGLTSWEPFADNVVRNCGPNGADRPHVVGVNYSYETPRLGRRLNSKILGAFTDNWTLSGITTASSGAPFTPSFSDSPSKDITGTPSLGARFLVVGDGRAAVDAGMDPANRSFVLRFEF